MSFRQLLEVSDALERKPAGPAPFQAATERVIPTFGRPGWAPPVQTVAPQRPHGGVSESPAVSRQQPAGLTAVTNRNRRRHTTGRTPQEMGDVSVVRNDLSDTDFMVVPARAQTAAPKRSAQDAPAGTRLGRFWDKCSARLLSLGLGWFKS